jgi:Domain of unknown function (DUF4136)
VQEDFCACLLFLRITGAAWCSYTVSPKARRAFKFEGITTMKIKFALCAMLLCFASAFAAGQQVSVNYNHSQSFTQFHTYAWGGNNANQVQNSILAQVAVQDTNTALQVKGLKMVAENQSPDLIVTASGGLKQETSYTAWGMRGIGGGMGGITPEQNVEGTLIIDLYDARGQSLLWRGIAESTLDNNGNKNQQMVQKAIQKMFKQWPS